MSENNLVVKHNKLIELKGKMTALEQKFLATVISKLKTEDTDFKEYTIYISEIEQYLLSKHKDVYGQLKKTVSSLRDRKIEIEKITAKGKKSFLITGWLSSARYEDGEGYVTVYIDPYLKPYLLELQGQFTKYELRQILELKSTHTIRIYELLKQYQTIKKRVFLVDNLKTLLGLENEYSRFSNFEKRVLVVAKQEINTTTDLFITYRKIKVGKKIGKIEFEIERRHSEKDLEYADAKMLCDVMDFNTRELAEKSSLIDFKINEKQFMEMYAIACEMTNKFNVDPCEYIKLNYEYMQGKNNVTNPVAYLKTILTKDGANARIKLLGL
ncbi:replication initiation protein [Lutibacter sp. B2]|nr:replication initiation protein [Lutibacter sp. B2]